MCQFVRLYRLNERLRLPDDISGNAAPRWSSDNAQYVLDIGQQIRGSTALLDVDTLSRCHGVRPDEIEGAPWVPFHHQDMLDHIEALASHLENTGAGLRYSKKLVDKARRLLGARGAFSRLAYMRPLPRTAGRLTFQKRAA